MTVPIHVARPPEKPVVLFDGDCAFCVRWVSQWQQITGSRVEYLPYQDTTSNARFSEIPRSSLEAAVHLIHPDGRVFHGAEAVFRALAFNRSYYWLLWSYQRLPGMAPACECVYSLVARHRTAASFMTRLLWGSQPQFQSPSYSLTRRLLLSGLGLVYLVALASLWAQLSGLIGPQGILPAEQYMDAAREYFGQAHQAGRRFWLMPTLGWISAQGTFLHGLCLVGVVSSGLLICGIAPAFNCFLLWIVYLSLTVLGREFLSFQWDALLLETGFLALLLAPGRLFPNWRLQPSLLVIWMLRWLLFRLMFESGCVKIFSGDLTWRQLTALQYHFETQPLPTWMGWYAHQGAPAFQQVCVAVLFGIELALPFLIFGPRRCRRIACLGFIVLQVWILLTGNYGFFNYLTILLSFTLLDDAAFRRFIPVGLRWFRPIAVDASGSRHSPLGTAPTFASHSAWKRIGERWAHWVRGTVMAALFLIGFEQVSSMLLGNWVWLPPMRILDECLAPFRVVNSYGLFAVMTTNRAEIIIEGSNDQKTWIPYGFKYKPGLLNRAPRFIAPHQPRLDWQMWFAALGTPQQNPWLVNLAVRLLEGAPSVLALLEDNPFPSRPPKYVRALVFQYHFTTVAERKRTGNWWKRDSAGVYLPAISLRER